MAYPLTKAELEFYESARRSLASISKTLESLEILEGLPVTLNSFKESYIQTRILKFLYHKLIHEKEFYGSWIGTGTIETEEQAFGMGRIRILEEMIKEIEDGKE